MRGATLLAEEPGLRTRAVAVVIDAFVAAAAAAGGAELSLSAAQPRRAFLCVARSDLDVGAGADEEAVAAAALATWQNYSALYNNNGSVLLRASHEAAWAALWESGIELTGNVTLAAAANASLYDLLSSVREGWPFSTSPGSLATNG